MQCMPSDHSRDLTRNHQQKHSWKILEQRLNNAILNNMQIETYLETKMYFELNENRNISKFVGCIEGSA